MKMPFLQKISILFFEEAAELLNALDESEGTIDEDTLTNLVEKYKSK